jgi:hypothetical protein
MTGVDVRLAIILLPKLYRFLELCGFREDAHLRAMEAIAPKTTRSKMDHLDFYDL